MREPSPLPPAPYPSLPVTFSVQGITGSAIAIIDTGFGGHLVVPSALIAALPRWNRLRRAGMVRGTEMYVPTYRGIVELIDQPGPVVASIVAVGDRYVLGLAMLNHFRIILDYGERVIVEP